MQSIQRCKKCGDLIWSTNVHDMVWCKCGAIAIDGGEDYCKVSGNLDDMESVKPIDALNLLKGTNYRLLTEIEHANEQIKNEKKANIELTEDNVKLIKQLGEDIKNFEQYEKTTIHLLNILSAGIISAIELAENRDQMKDQVKIIVNHIIDRLKEAK